MVGLYIGGLTGLNSHWWWSLGTLVPVMWGWKSPLYICSLFCLTGMLWFIRVVGFVAYGHVGLTGYPWHLWTDMHLIFTFPSNYAGYYLSGAGMLVVSVDPVLPLDFWYKSDTTLGTVTCPAPVGRIAGSDVGLDCYCRFYFVVTCPLLVAKRGSLVT
jgi:hypothetical protein